MRHSAPSFAPSFAPKFAPSLAPNCALTSAFTLLCELPCACLPTGTGRRALGLVSLTSSNFFGKSAYSLPCGCQSASLLQRHPWQVLLTARGGGDLPSGADLTCNRNELSLLLISRDMMQWGSDTPQFGHLIAVLLSWRPVRQRATP